MAIYPTFLVRTMYAAHKLDPPLTVADKPFLLARHRWGEDKLADPSGGRRTAEAIPGARFVLIEGMGHDYPPAYWDQIVALVTEHAPAPLAVVEGTEATPPVDLRTPLVAAEVVRFTSDVLRSAVG